MMNRKQRNNVQKAFLVTLIVLLSVGLLLPSFASILMAV